MYLQYIIDNRCPTYTNLPNTCRLVGDKNDACCVVPDCNVFPTRPPTTLGPDGKPYTGATSPLPIILPTPVQSSFTGTGTGGVNPLTPGGQPGSSGQTSK